MNCPSCGAVNPPGAKWCSSCRALLGAAAGSTRRGMAIASLVLGILGLPTFGLLFVGAIAGIVLGIVALVNASREPAVYGGKGLAIAGIVLSGLSIVMIPFIGIIAAIVIPSLLRARISANEAGAIGDIRTVISGEAAYQSANGGFYDKLECLGAPQGCIPGYAGPTILDQSLVAAQKQGYRRRFYPGPPPTSRPTTPVSPSSMTAYAYVAVPLEPGRTGMRAFCGDSSGIICVMNDGSEPVAEGGVCPESCPPIR